MPPRKRGRAVEREKVLVSLDKELLVDIEAVLAVPTSYGGDRNALIETAVRDHIAARLQAEPLFSQAFRQERARLGRPAAEVVAIADASARNPKGTS